MLIYCENKACERHNTLEASIEYFCPINNRWFKLCWYCEEYFKRLGRSMRDSSRWRKLRLIEEVNPNQTFEDLGLCPCGRHFYVNMDNSAVAHDVPQCRDFKQMTTDRYLQFVRESRAN
jgi:hypothetical protein